jgi:hypothetical protein
MRNDNTIPVAPSVKIIDDGSSRFDALVMTKIPATNARMLVINGIVVVAILYTNQIFFFLALQY